MMTKYADIIERLEKATGPSEELGVRIKCALLAPETAYVEKSRHNGLWVIYDGEWKGQPRCWEYRGVSNDLRLANPTASIDAAIALVERMLPEANCYGVEKEPNCWSAYVSRNCVPDGHWLKEASAPTAPLAILLALFRALEAKEGG